MEPSENLPEADLPDDLFEDPVEEGALDQPDDFGDIPADALFAFLLEGMEDEEHDAGWDDSLDSNHFDHHPILDDFSEEAVCRLSEPLFDELIGNIVDQVAHDTVEDLIAGALDFSDFHTNEEAVRASVRWRDEKAEFLESWHEAGRTLSDPIFGESDEEGAVGGIAVPPSHPKVFDDFTDRSMARHFDDDFVQRFGNLDEDLSNNLKCIF